MLVQQVSLDLWLPNLNQLMGMHRYRYNSVKKGFQSQVIPVFMDQLKPVVEYPVRVEFKWYAPNRRSDPDNISSAGCKILLDALQMAGVLANDGFRQIDGFYHSFHLDKQNPRIVIKIEEPNGERDSG